MNRELFHWNVTLQGEDGQVTQFPISAYWSPNKEGTELALMAAAKGMAFWQAARAMKYIPVGIKRVV